ncbi:MAG: nucleotidyltransferase family protein [Roseiflexus sp.]|nr:nucleotidyltransferase family protein [Roseiflexus sp.]MCS7289685.1 nucleotidyltransferase family protein [Roseiflexus sp.]MDW8148712.1 nucleotidyltransferase family protein [Roseiflexaceae bacterium]MDW8232385.1 nucleotidyltransferase family protein [Roseiflexaceae bacterium]
MTVSRQYDTIHLQAEQRDWEKEDRLLSREAILALLRQHYSSLAAEYGVKRVGLFGLYARGSPDAASDIDLVVEFERPIGFRFVELAEYLEDVLGREVDILTPEGIRGIRLPWVAAEIEESVIYVEADHNPDSPAHKRLRFTACPIRHTDS